jgi:EPS-associated MarR family transcriptional regulator
MLSERPHASQREIARELGISLGRTNYLLRALVAKGLIKIENFRTSPHKLGYWHVLTPRGIAERAALSARFLQRKLADYAALEAEIAAIRGELAAIEGGNSAVPNSAGRVG